MNPGDPLDDDRWAEIDRRILACDPDGAYRRIRELTGSDPESTHEIRRERFRRLRTERAGGFAWTRYPCGDYLASRWAETGYWDESAQLMLIVPGREVVEARSLLVVGHPGVDGIELGYRREQPGLWAYRPMGGELDFVAETIAALVGAREAGDLNF